MAQIFPQQRARLTTTNGLPHNAIAGVEQDRAGFVWIATADGLARYDGRMVKVFRNRPGDSLSLANNKITQLLPAPDGTFIVTTEPGTIQQFDPATERFTTLLHRQFLDRHKAFVNQLQLSADGRHLWGLLPGVRLIDYDIRRKSLRTYDVPTLVGSANEVHDFILTPTGYIYGETLAGLFQFDTRTGRKRIIPFPFKNIDRLRAEGFWSINRHQVALGPNGQIAVFGYDVIALYDPVRERFRTVPIPGIVRVGTGNARRLATVVTYALKTTADNHLYVGYMDQLYRLDEPNRLTIMHHSENAGTGLAPWLIDQSGVLWISGESAGLTKLDLHQLPFGFQPVRKSFSEDLLEQNLGVALPDSFEVWDNNNWPRYTTDRAGTGYLIDPSRVYRYTTASRTLTELTKFGQIDGRICCKLCLKTSGRHSGGRRSADEGLIWVYNNRRGLIAISADGTKGYSYPNSQVPLKDLYPGYDVGDIQPLGQSVWVGSQYGLGLFRYDIGRKRFDPPMQNNPRCTNSLPVNSINCLSADPDDSTVLWIGTMGGGLCRLSTASAVRPYPVFQRLGEAEGFPDETIQSIETDRQGMLWCATNRGLVRVNPHVGTLKTLTWRHFTTDDGLADDAFLSTSSAHLPDGRLVFGTPNGRVIFDPRAIRDDSYEPPIVLTSLLINNRPVEANQPGIGPASSSLPAPLNTLSELILDHTQNFLTIGFAGLHYGKAEKLSYRYQLTGVDTGWVTTGNQNTANYTQLAPGQYVFRVNSTTADGRWSRRIKQLPIVITPPLWATWWAYLAYALAFGSLVLGFIRFRVGQVRQHQEIQLKRREAEQLRAVDEVKTRFFSNITHEFRTPLTLILSPTARLLQTVSYDAFTRQTLTTIYQNAGQLLRLINQLLDLSKLEGGNMTVSLVRGDAVALIQRLAETFYPTAAIRGIALEVVINGSAGTNGGEAWPAYQFDADKWERIITNLLANALKFTPTGGQVVLTIETPRLTDATVDHQLVLSMADTGIGIPDRHLPHIFDRFYQADDSRTRAYEGTGIGLALVKELTDLLGGTITVQSRTEDPTGTTFTLTLPLLPDTQRADAPDLVLPDAPVATTGLPVADILPPPPIADSQPKPVVADDAPLVLVVDDNDELRTFVANELANRYRVLTAADGEEAWTICQRDLPDVVVSDVMMPHRDGYQLTHCIKSTLATNHIAVVLLTARAAHQSRIAGLEQGADDYLTKPFHADELLLRLNNLLTSQQNLRAFLHRQLSALTPSTEELMEDAFVGQLHQALELRLDDPTFGVDDLATAVAMSRRTLHRKLTATTNLSANDFIRHYRLQRATQLLRTGHSIAETAYSVGFESPAYFSKLFKQTYHQTPSEFLDR